MGMYTELDLNAELRRDTPDEVLGVLRYMVGGSAKPPAPPSHPLFETARWRSMLTCDSYYFDAWTHSRVIVDNIAHATYLNVRCNLKNYDDEIGKFLDWIDPWLEKDKGEFLGFYRYEESEEPALIYKRFD